MGDRMICFRSCLHIAALVSVLSVASAAVDAASVLAYHGGANRSGHVVVPGLTLDRARNVHLDPKFRGEIAGHVYAQPLYWHPSGSDPGLLFAATEDDTVYALDADTGSTVWRVSLGKPAPRSSLPCGNINPLGITGTPIIDESTQTVYLDAVSIYGDRPQHLIFRLSLRDGSTLSGWPVNVADALRPKSLDFNARDQNQRGALTIVGDRVYVPYGGHYGDCGQYHGWVIGVSLHDPKDVIAWATRARGGGVWAPGGISYDGRSLFAATGNTMDAKEWADGEAVIRLGLDLQRSDRPQDYFAPNDWRALDRADADLGGTNPLPLDVPGRGGLHALLLALGKDGKAYLLDRNNLDGIGGALAVSAVSDGPIRTAPAAYRVGDAVLVAFQGEGSACPTRVSNVELTVLSIRSEPKPSIATAWCGSLRGAGAPIVTTSDEQGSDPIVWIVGAEGDDRLHGFRGDTGVPLTTDSAEVMKGLRHFVTILAANDHLYVAADGRVYAFSF
jgi:outer membrane protein assembly factor BamB